MLETVRTSDIEFTEIIIRPYLRLTKLLGVALLVTLLFITLTFLGYRGQRHKTAPIPNTIINLSEYAVPVLVLLVPISILGIILLLRMKDINEDQVITIHRKILKIRRNVNLKIINLKHAEKVSFCVLPLFHKLYNDQFYRIGQLTFYHGGQKYDFTFPVRNESIGNELSNICKELQPK